MMFKVRIALGASDIYGEKLHVDDYKLVYDVVGETPTTVMISVRGERRTFSKVDITYSI